MSISAPSMSISDIVLSTLGFTARTAIPIAFCSYFLVSLPSALTGRIGTFTYTPFPVNIRASFGPWGSVVPILARMIIGLVSSNKYLGVFIKEHSPD